MSPLVSMPPPRSTPSPPPPLRSLLGNQPESSRTLPRRKNSESSRTLKPRPPELKPRNSPKLSRPFPMKRKEKLNPRHPESSRTLKARDPEISRTFPMKPRNPEFSRTLPREKPRPPVESHAVVKPRVPPWTQAPPPDGPLGEARYRSDLRVT